MQHMCGRMIQQVLFDLLSVIRISDLCKLVLKTYFLMSQEETSFIQDLLLLTLFATCCSQEHLACLQMIKFHCLLPSDDQSKFAKKQRGGQKKEQE
ncbi:hypothetical protein BRADI_4g30613v3 [Brachypodium distachyon]|uniref:Uncharacterized protein n=1 Tax=Brachypodium distachyon TaxID=15368 RepID=A0A2K2CRF8_BRADI|nr:hypothetical protein BRADI_4g30613v3 [Brachypodium distachyon]